MLAVSGRIWVHLRVLQTFADSYDPPQNTGFSSFSWKVTEIVWGGAQWARALPEKFFQIAFSYWCNLVAFIRYQKAPTRKRNLKKFLGEGLTEPLPKPLPKPSPSELYVIYHTEMDKETSSTPKNFENPQQIFLVAPLIQPRGRERWRIRGGEFKWRSLISRYNIIQIETQKVDTLTPISTKH